MTQDNILKLDIAEFIDLGAASEETYGAPGQTLEFENEYQIVN